MIGRLSLFIGTRLHPSLFALSSMVPVLTVHDQPKVTAFMDFTGLSEWHMEASGLDPTELVSKLIELRDKRADIVEILKVKVPQLQAMAIENLDHIAKCTDRNKLSYQ